MECEKCTRYSSNGGECTACDGCAHVHAECFDEPCKTCLTKDAECQRESTDVTE